MLRKDFTVLIGVTRLLITAWEQLIGFTGAVQRRKDSRRDPLEQQNLNLGDTSMDSAVPQAAAIGSLRRPACPCKGLSEADSVVVRVSVSPETISLAPFPRGRAKQPILLLRVVWERNGGRFARM
jgi:hypothetical protein